MCISNPKKGRRQVLSQEESSLPAVSLCLPVTPLMGKLFSQDITPLRVFTLVFPLYVEDHNSNLSGLSMAKFFFPSLKCWSLAYIICSFFTCFWLVLGFFFLALHFLVPESAPYFLDS